MVNYGSTQTEVISFHLGIIQRDRMLTLPEVRRLIANKKIRWIVKANVLRSLHENYRNLDQFAYDLNMSRRTLDNWLKLSKYLHFFPKLGDILERAEALKIIFHYSANSIELRKQINIAALRYRSRLARLQIKNSMWSGEQDD